MLTWRAEALILSARPLGETDAIVQVLTRDHGRRAGVVKGGAGRRLRATLQPGDTVLAEWRARLETHLGTARVEPVRARSGAVLADADALAGLSSLCALLGAFLPEAEPHPHLYDASLALLDRIVAGPGWAAYYARWELLLLAELGFGLDLESCAATGATGELVWVSPKSGRAVSRAAGAPYADKLLPLPGFLRGEGQGDGAGIAAALRLTGWFLTERAAPAFGVDAPPSARARLVERLRA